jgi:hypothetical protein
MNHESNPPVESDSFANLMERHLDVSQRLTAALVARSLPELEQCMEEQRLLAFELTAKSSVPDPSIRALAQIVKDLNQRNARLVENGLELSHRMLNVICPPVTYALSGNVSSGVPSSGISFQG